MSTSAPSRRHTAGRHVAAHEPPGPRDRSRRSEVEWAWGLIAVTLPAAIVAAGLANAVIRDLGMTMGMPHSAAEAFVQNLLNYLFYAAVTAPLLASIVVGLRGWRRDHETLALRAAHLSAGLLVVGTVLIVLSW